MTVTIGGGQQQSQDSWGGVQVLGQSTATTEQTISIYYPVTTIAGTTATSGVSQNRYVVPFGREGDRKAIFLLATGQAWVRFGGATSDALATGALHQTTFAGTSTTALGVFTGSATGAWVMTTVNSYIEAIFQNGGWWLKGTNATIGTAT